MEIIKRNRKECMMQMDRVALLLRKHLAGTIHNVYITYRLYISAFNSDSNPYYSLYTHYHILGIGNDMGTASLTWL